MSLSNDIISDFSKLFSTEKDTIEKTVYGIAADNNGILSVKLDGSNILTPVRTTIGVEVGDRVTVLLKDRTATITGNMTSPAANVRSVTDIATTVDSLETNYIIVNEKLVATDAEIETLKAGYGYFNVLYSDYATFKSTTTDKLIAVDANITNLVSDYGDFKDLTTDDLTAIRASINTLDSEKISVDDLDATKAEITTLVVDEIDGRYATIDFANIDTAKVDKNIVSLLLAEVGLIDRATIVEGHVTKILDAVEINANSITSGTLVTDRLVLSGSEGSILYELNNLGELTSTNVNTLDGYLLTDRTIHADKLIANSITANELDVTNIFGNTAVLNTIVSQDIFSDAIATHTMVVGAYEYAEEAVNLSKPTNESQGSPILLTDSADGSLIDFKAYGRSEQKQYTGKNLWEYGDQSFTYNISKAVNLKPGTYTFSAIVTSSDDQSDVSRVFFFDENGSTVRSGDLSRNTRSSITVELNKDVTSIRLYTAGWDSISAADTATYKDIQLELSDTMTDYEPYVGGTASPNPSYPQEIKSIADSGWFDGELLQGYWDDTTGNYTSNNYRVCSKNKIQCKSGDVIEITTENKDVELWRVNYYKEDGTFISVDNNQISTAPTNASYFYITVGKRLMDGNVGFKISDAGHICVTINDTYAVKVKSVGKNLFNPDTAIKGYCISDDSGDTLSVSNAYASDYILIKPNENYFIHSEATRGMWGAWYDINKNFIRGISGYNKVHTAPSNASYMRLTVNYYNSNPNFADNFQVEIGNSFTEFEPYKESITYIPLTEPLRSSLDGSVKDEISCVDGVYGVTRRLKGVVFDGSSDENWTANGDVSVFYIVIDNIKKLQSCICDHFGNSYTNSVGYLCINVSDTNCTTLTEFKTWLQSNAITIEYELANSVFEPFEDQSIFDNIVTFNHITTISTTDNPDMIVKYYRNNESGEQFSNFVDVSKRTEEVATNASNNANNALNTANTANTNAESAMNTASTANTNATNAMNTANTANSTANTASTNATNALDRATYRYGTCSTAAGTAAKVVSLSGFKLYTGAQVTVLFTYANTVANPTLNVNSTGAKNIRVNGANIISKYYWYANNTITFTYDGTYWVMSDTSANTILANWASNNDITYIDGGKIYTGSITADKIDVEDLFAQDITATGTIRGATFIGGLIKSENFSPFNSGMCIDLEDGSLTSKNMLISDDVVTITTKNGSVFYDDEGFKVDDTLIVSNETILKSTLDVTGDTSLGADIDVHGGATMWKTLDVYGATTLGSTLSVTGNTTIGGSLQISGDGLELFHATPFIDFHYNKSTSDYTSRIIESSSGHLDIKASNGITATGYIKNTGANIILGTNNKFLYGVSTTGTEYALIGLNSSNQCDIAPVLANVVIGKAATSLTIGAASSLTNFGGRIQTGGGIEINSTSPYIDFHYNNSTADYDVRLINNESGKLHCLGHYAPTANDTYQLGYAGKRWKQLYACTSTISTSDRRLKYDFEEFDERYDTLYDLLKPYLFKLINGDSGRSHSGFVSQDVEEALQLAGLTALDFAGFCKDVKQKSVVVTPAEYDENGNIISEAYYESVDDLDENGNLQYEYSLRYEEFIALNTNQIQKLKARNTELETRVADLEEALSKLLQ